MRPGHMMADPNKHEALEVNNPQLHTAPTL